MTDARRIKQVDKNAATGVRTMTSESEIASEVRYQVERVAWQAANAKKWKEADEMDEKAKAREYETSSDIRFQAASPRPQRTTRASPAPTFSSPRPTRSCSIRRALQHPPVHIASPTRATPVSAFSSPWANAKKLKDSCQMAKESETASEVRYQAERVAERAANAKKWKEAAEKAEMAEKVVKIASCKRCRTRSSFADNRTNRTKK